MAWRGCGVNDFLKRVHEIATKTAILAFGGAAGAVSDIGQRGGGSVIR
jgi:hypothetical protein